MDQQFLRRDQAADYLQTRFGAFTRQTLAKLACVGGGPRFRKMGRFPVYTPADLDAWAEARMSPPVGSTSELAHCSGRPSASGDLEERAASEVDVRR